jgi:hypothetical protein
MRPSAEQKRAMIDLHYWSTPNGHKITMFLEETGLKYKIFPVNIGKGEQFEPEFLAIAPNNRIPAMVDHEPKSGAKPISIFESGAMLLYLAEKILCPGVGAFGRGPRADGLEPALEVRKVVDLTAPKKSARSCSARPRRW